MQINTTWLGFFALWGYHHRAPEMGFKDRSSSLPQGCQFPPASISPMKEENQKNLGITFCLTSWSKLTMHCMCFHTVALVYIKFIQFKRQVSGWT
jgi:hypothetical protein